MFPAAAAVFKELLSADMEPTSFRPMLLKLWSPGHQWSMGNPLVVHEVTRRKSHFTLLNLNL